MIRVIKVMVAVKLGVRSYELMLCVLWLVAGGCWWLLIDEKCCVCSVHIYETHDD